MDMLLRLFKAVANEKRTKLLTLLLKDKVLLLENIAEKMGIPEATATRNLKILQKVKLIRSFYRRGKVYYELNVDPTLPYNMEILALIRNRKRENPKL